jgi:peptidyl-prolyl cis-trans isomerase B (cyclophilin B)
MERRRWLPLLFVALSAPAFGQAVNPARLAILQAEDRRAPTAADLATIRAGVRSADPQTARLAVRALGRLERPSLIPDILPALVNRYAEVRAEAANAVAQAASGVKRGANGGPTPTVVLQRLIARLANEEDTDARAALAESIGRLPYSEAADVGAAQQALLDLAAQRADVPDRLAVAKAFEALARIRKDVTLSAQAVEFLRGLVGAVSLAGAEPLSPLTVRTAGAGVEPLKDARVRRLALEALSTANAVDTATIERGFADMDAQVRRLAVRAAARLHAAATVRAGLADPAAMVRLEAVKGVPGATGEDACVLTIGAAADPNPHVALQAIDQLGACGSFDPAVARLLQFAGDVATLDAPRGWHPAAHALAALAAAAPDRVPPLLEVHARAKNHFVRVYAVKAAETLKDRSTLERFASDPDDNVVEAAVDALSRLAGAAASARYVAALDRRGYQAVRAAARALESSPSSPELIAALNAALERLVAEKTANSLDARKALVATLERLGASPPTTATATPHQEAELNLADLRRLAAPRARLTIRGVGVIDAALITMEAPATVLRFAQLAERGYYNGLTIHRVAPNFVLQGGSPDANEYVGQPDHMRDEVGLWPHVRGAVGISTRGRDTGDAQIFFDLVDNPRLDHEFTVFAQVLAGLDAMDRVLEGDVIDSVQILDGR